MEQQFYNNAKAYHTYEVIQDYNAGLVLQGVHVKAIRSGRLNISESFCRVIKNEVFLFNIVLDGIVYNDIKMLLNKKEIKKIAEEVSLNNRTIVPLNLTMSVYAKMKIGVCKGKKNWNKKESIKLRDLDREQKRENV